MRVLEVSCVAPLTLKTSPRAGFAAGELEVWGGDIPGAMTSLGISGVTRRVLEPSIPAAAGDSEIACARSGRIQHAAIGGFVADRVPAVLAISSVGPFVPPVK
jgi:hypothetical protein